VFKFAGIFFCGALVFLAGCATSQRELPPDWTGPNDLARAENPPVIPPWPPIPAVVPTNQIVQTNRVAILITNPPQKILPSAPVLTWTSLDRWAKENKIGSPRRRTVSPVVTWSVTSPAGVLVLTIGSHEATWNGITLHLGFPPENIDNQIFIHSLDLQKNLAPLLLGETLNFSTNRIVVIDPGHGGINGGTKNVLGGRPEKDFTLDWARRLAPLLATNGWQVFLTRSNDSDVSLYNRVAIAEAHHADLFISLHFNSSAPGTRQGGLETYCLTPTRMPSTLTRGYSDLWSESFPNNSFDVENLLLAVRVHDAVLRASGEEDRGIRRARFMGVLHGQRRPAVLIEGGFLSNPRETARIESAEFRQKLAQAVADALR
jgi:N-acetylmuramoyl-L-alanine amidase